MSMLREQVIRPVITPHPLAPLFDAPDRDLILRQLLSEVSSGNFPATETFLALMRQASLVNLWFFLKCVASYAGPYDKLTPDLHLDMCNFRQLLCNPGAKLGGFVPRSTFKSTCWTHGGAAWDAIRNPDIRIGIFSSVYDRAHSFFSQTQRIFDSNELFTAVFPEYVPNKYDGNRWNDSEGVLPNRTRNFPEPTFKAIAAGGSTQGIHVDVALFDDIVGDQQLNADHGATADMYRIKNWFKSSIRTLLISMTESRLMLSATRYAVDDPYEDPMKEAYEHYGYWDELEDDYPIDPQGEWQVYYRTAEEKGESIFPQAYTLEDLAKIARDDPWTYQTQYMNNPMNSGSVEFAAYHPIPFELSYESHRGWEIIISNSGEVVPLSACDVVMAIDPAGSEKMVSIRTSRSVVLVLAQDWKGRRFVLNVRAGFVPTTTWFDWAFSFKELYGDILRSTYVEQQAGFKSLTSIIRGEERNRKKYIGYVPINALGDKVVTIRNILQPILDGSLLYINEQCYDVVMEELRTFPASIKRDILDALKIAAKFSSRPDSIEDREASRSKQDEWMSRANRVTGY